MTGRYTILLFCFIVLTWSVSPAFAQKGGNSTPTPTPTTAPASAEPLCPGLGDVVVGDTVTGTVSNDSYLIGYCYNAVAGETITLEVTATSGNLDTYVGISDDSFVEVFAENDDVADGNTNSALTFTFPTAGYYTIIVTRFDLDAGTSTGDYRMIVSGTSSTGSSGGTKNPLGTTATNTPEPEFLYPTVGDGVFGTGAQTLTITCDTGEVVNAGIEFSFINVNPGYPYTVTVMGLDGFDPVVAVETSPGVGNCNDDDSGARGSVFVVPGVGDVVADQFTSQLDFTTPQYGYPTNITVGSANGIAGEFIMIIEGLRVDPADDLDGFSLRVPSVLATEPLAVYMVSKFADLDPYVAIGYGDGLTNAYIGGELDQELIDYNNVFFPVYECDDMGVGTCDFVPSLGGGLFSIRGGEDYVVNEFDAGLVLIPNTADPILYGFGSVNSGTTGDYAIVVIGQVPGQ